VIVFCTAVRFQSEEASIITIGYDRELRPELMVQAITGLQDAGMEPDVWKIEGIDRPEDRAAVQGGTRDDRLQGD
jgi:hypothetical protein